MMRRKINRFVSIVLVMLMCFAIGVNAVQAENPPNNASNNPFAPHYVVSTVDVKSIYEDNMPLFPTFTYPANFLVRDGDCVWMLAEYDEKNKQDGSVIPHYVLIKINENTGDIVDRYEIKGKVWYREDVYNDGYNYQLHTDDAVYVFSEKTKHVIYVREGLLVRIINS